MASLPPHFSWSYLLPGCLSNGRNSAGAQEGRFPGLSTQCEAAGPPEVSVCLRTLLVGLTCELHSLSSHGVKTKSPRKRLQVLKPI